MKIAIIILSCAAFAYGVIYGFASSPDYHVILPCSILLELVAIAGFVWWSFQAAGGFRFIPIVLLVIALYVAIQAAMRLRNL